MNTINPQTAILLASTMGAGWLMVTAGLQKKALERRQRHRTCAGCGKHLPGRSVCRCAN